MNRAEGIPVAPFVIPNFLRFWVEQEHIQTGAIVIRRDVTTRAGRQREDFESQPGSRVLAADRHLRTMGIYTGAPVCQQLENKRQKKLDHTLSTASESLSQRRILAGASPGADPGCGLALF